MLHEQLDTSSATGRLTMHIFADLAQFSVIWTAAGGRAQMPRYRACGHVGGRLTAMTNERRQVAQRMLDDGYRPTQVADTLGVSRATIYRHLKV